MTMKKKKFEKENEAFKLHNETSQLENALEHAEKENYLLGKTLNWYQIKMISLKM